MIRLLKVLVILCFLVSPLVSSAQFKLGGGLEFITSGSSLGVQVRGVYDFTEQYGAQASITYYFVKDVTTLGYDINGRYYFTDAKDGFKPYALAGLNILTASATVTGFGTVSASSNALNLGVGAHYPISDGLELFGEAKYAVRSGGYLALTAGVLFPIGGK